MAKAVFLILLFSSGCLLPARTSSPPKYPSFFPKEKAFERHPRGSGISIFHPGEKVPGGAHAMGDTHHSTASSRDTPALTTAPCHPEPRPGVLGPNMLSREEPTEKSRFWGGLSSSLDHRWRFRCLLASMAARRWSFPGYLPFLQPSRGDGLPWSIPPGGRRLQTHPSTTFLIYGTRAADLSQALLPCQQPMGTPTENRIDSKLLKLLVGWRQLLGLQTQKAPQETISSTLRPIYAVTSETG